MKTLVMGYGNTLRGDDGIGLWMAQQIEQDKLPGVLAAEAQQLPIEAVDDCEAYDRVVLLDCAAGGPAFALQPLHPDAASGIGTSHYVTASLMVSLARLLNKKVPEFYLGSVRGESFDLGAPITAEVYERARALLKELRGLLSQEEEVHHA